MSPRRRRTRARPPADFHDWVAVDRAVSGLHPGRPLTVAERREAVRLLFRRGVSLTESAVRLRVSDRTVLRDRHVLGLTEHEQAIAS